MTETGEPETLLPLTPAVLHILLALSGGERHGYAIMQEVAAQTQGTVKMGPGTLYGSMKRLLAAGLVEEAGEHAAPDTEKERRRYYRLTHSGRKTLEAELRRLAQVVQLPAAQRLLSANEGSA